MGFTYIESEPLTAITLAVKDGYTGYIETKPLHGSQTRFSTEEQKRLHKKYSTFTGYTFYGLELKPNREFYNMIYRNGDNILLVGPKPIRDKMVYELESVLRRIKSIQEE